MENYHIPVMLKEVLEYLRPAPGKKYIDCTLGGGGYALPLAQKVKKRGLVIGIDLDKKAISHVQKIIKQKNITNIKLQHGNFKDIKQIAQKLIKMENIKFDGIVFDLGVSSAQLEDRSRGISFKLAEAPLIMEFDPPAGGSSAVIDLLNTASEEELAQIFYNYGEEKFSRRIAKEIIRQRTKTKIKIKTVGQLIEIITNAVPAKYRKSRKIHFATKIFQALRIAANAELDNLQEGLKASLDLLKREGRLVVVSYHSLEDRIVKQFIKESSKECICPPEKFFCDCGHVKSLRPLTKKVLIPQADEIRINPKARSAKLRAAEKII